jgi:beta-lactamase regulating signal transducer with metallopeptidase domain
MSPLIEITLTAILVAALLLLQLRTSLLILRDTLSESTQRILQFSLVWLLPMIGAIIVLAVHRPTEKSSGQYRNLPEPGDDFGYSSHPNRGGKIGLDDVADVDQ